MGWIIFLALAVPLVGVVAWIALDESFVRIEPGQLGLLLIKGRATDTALEPGPHWVPAMRRRMVQTYPSLELSYRAGADEAPVVGDLERSGPALRAALADRAGAVAVVHRALPARPRRLRTVHERFGPEGIWAAVRDVSESALRTALAAATVDDVFAGRPALQQRLARRRQCRAGGRRHRRHDAPPRRRRPRPYRRGDRGDVPGPPRARAGAGRGGDAHGPGPHRRRRGAARRRRGHGARAALPRGRLVARAGPRRRTSSCRSRPARPEPPAEPAEAPAGDEGDR